MTMEAAEEEKCHLKKLFESDVEFYHRSIYGCHDESVVEPHLADK